MARSPRACLVLTSVASSEQATALARKTVAAGRAACVSVLPGARSFYEWSEERREEDEVLLLIKTSTTGTEDEEALLAELAAEHPYDEPELLVFYADGGSASYLRWVFDARARRRR